jgi:hypothetical protein
MSFPSGGPGYPQQGGGAQPGPQPPNTGGFPPQQPVQPGAPGTTSAPNIPTLLGLAVTVLGLVNYFLGYSEEAQGADQVIQFLLVAGLLTALNVLPKGPRHMLPFAALFSVLGALTAILVVVRVPSEAEVPGIVTVLLILGILQAIVAVGALLLDHDVLKLPAAKPQPSPYGRPYSQHGPFSQPPQSPQSPFGQPQQGPNEQAGPAAQPTKFGPPVSSPGAQPTTYAAQQGQFYQQQKPDSSQQGQNPPGTPPGGIGKQD